MKFWLILFVVFLPYLTWAEKVLPPKPSSRVSDLDGVFDPKTREFLSQRLKVEFGRNKISAYVVAISEGEKGQETATANRLRDAWIKEPVGLIILFTRSSDKISISLTDAAYRLIAAGGKLELLATKIDGFNEEGPSRGMPNVVNLLLDRLRLDRRQIVVVQEREVPKALILVPFCILLAAAGVGLFKLYRYMEAQNVFTPSYTLKSEPVVPVLGSTIGGVNMAEAKF